MSAPGVAVDQARILRDEGIERALAAADNAQLQWSERALGYLVRHARQHETFTAELVRIAAENDGFPAPPDRRAWGGILVRAQHRQWVVKWDRTRATDPKVHCNEVTVWKSLIYTGS